MKGFMRILLALAMTASVGAVSADGGLDAVRADFDAVRPAEAAENCAEVMFSPGSGRDERRQAAALAALAYILADEPERCGDLAEMLEGDGDFAGSPALTVVRYLAGSLDDAEFAGKSSGWSRDWSLFGVLCRYVRLYRSGAGGDEIKPLAEKYLADSSILSSSWEAACRRRIVVWHGRAVANGRGDSSGLEPGMFSAPAGKEVAPEVSAIPPVEKKIIEIIDLYLSGAAAAAEERAAAAAAGDAGREAVFEALAGRGGWKPEDIFNLTSAQPSVWALACLGLFAREAALKPAGELDRAHMEYLVQNYFINLEYIDSKLVLARRPQAGRWRRWVASGFKNNEGMPEPVFASGSPVESDSDTTPEGGFNPAALAPEVLAGGRGRFSSRPRPADLTFDRGKMKSYIESLPEPADRKIELKRYNRMKSVKNNLIRIFERNPYRGVIKYKNRTLKGVVYMANDEILMIRKSKKSKKSKRVKWRDLDFSQYIEFVKYFAEMRLAADAPGVTAEERRENAADDYLSLAVLCDWFGRYGEALRFAAKAVELNPRLKKDAGVLLAP